MVWCHGIGMLLYMLLCAHDNSNEEGKPTFLSMSCHPSGPTMATHPLPGMGSHAGIRKGYPPPFSVSFSCRLLLAFPEKSCIQEFSILKSELSHPFPRIKGPSLFLGDHGWFQYREIAWENEGGTARSGGGGLGGVRAGQTDPAVKSHFRLRLESVEKETRHTVHGHTCRTLEEGGGGVVSWHQCVGRGRRGGNILNGGKMCIAVRLE
jgi:hypothetical protein